MKKNKIMIKTKLSEEECINRLKQYKYKASDYWNKGEDKTYINIKGNKISIWRRQKYTTNSFGRVFFGNITENENYTVIEGKFRYNILILFVFTMLIPVSFITFLFDLEYIWGMLIGISMFLILYFPISSILFYLGYRIGAKSEDIIIDQLSGILDGE
ncbi:hypothetical protein IZY60_07690 [Lutibacter sp. B2]|nr:hypothetical protein [Lutibacter sp. B2]